MVFPLEPFDQLLREKIAELEADDAEQEALRHDPVEHLRLAASRTLLLEEGGALPQQGGHVYAAASDRMTEESPKLDLLF